MVGGTGLPLVFSCVLSFFLDVALYTVVFYALFLYAITRPGGFSGTVSGDGFVGPLGGRVDRG